MTEHEPYLARDKAKGGIAAGLIAGTVMGLTAMIRSAVADMGFWFPLQQIAGIIYGVDGLIASPGSIWVGFLVHMATAAAWGLVFGLTIDEHTTIGWAIIKGLGFGIVVWAVTTWLVLPWANETMAARVNMISRWWLGYHLIYGGMLFLTPTLVKNVAAPSSVPHPAVEQDR